MRGIEGVGLFEQTIQVGGDFLILDAEVEDPTFERLDNDYDAVVARGEAVYGREFGGVGNPVVDFLFLRLGERLISVQIVIVYGTEKGVERRAAGIVVGRELKLAIFLPESAAGIYGRAKQNA